MTQINYQVAKLMLVFADEEHALCKQVANEIYLRSHAEFRDASFQHSGAPVYPEYQAKTWNDAMARVKMYDTLGRESLVLAQYLETLIDEANLAYKI